MRKLTTILSVTFAVVNIVYVHICAPISNTPREAMSCNTGDSPQYRDGRFKNDAEWKDISISESIPLIRDYLFGDEQRTPDTKLPQQNVDLSFFNSTGSNQLNATWIGHSTLMINIDGYKIISDPVFEKRISIIGPSRFHGEPPLNIDQLTEIDEDRKSVV